MPTYDTAAAMRVLAAIAEDLDPEAYDHERVEAATVLLDELMSVAGESRCFRGERVRKDIVALAALQKKVVVKWDYDARTLVALRVGGSDTPTKIGVTFSPTDGRFLGPTTDQEDPTTGENRRRDALATVLSVVHRLLKPAQASTIRVG